MGKPNTVRAKLRCLDHRGETINTRWGDVTFDRDGLAEFEVPEAELPMLRAMKPYSWLAEDHAAFTYAKEVAADKAAREHAAAEHAKAVAIAAEHAKVMMAAEREREVSEKVAKKSSSQK